MVEHIVAGDSREELDDPRARPEVMAEFAEATGGRAFTPEDASILAEAINLSSSRFTQTTAVAVWNLPITMILLVGLVCADCFIRKRRGMA